MDKLISLSLHSLPDIFHPNQGLWDQTKQEGGVTSALLQLEDVTDGFQLEKVPRGWKE